MKPRPISTPRQLGASIYDARTAAGMTQATLASRAGVSRRWLIGLEQGARTGAELSKVFDVLHALGLSIHLSEAPELRRRSPTEDSTDGSIGDSAATTSNLPINAGTLEAIQKMRANLSGNTAALEAIQKMRAEISGNTAALEALRRTTSSSLNTVESIRRTASSLNTAALTAIEQAAEEPSRRTEDEKE